MVYCNAYITGEYNALYTPTNHAFFHCSNVVGIAIVEIYMVVSVCRLIHCNVQNGK